MFGTGELASSASESTRPSCTSSSCRSGTYCRQMGSPGDLMSSTIAGEMRNSKFSAACRSRARSGKCSAPNLATSASSEAMLCLHSSCCQGSMRQILEIDHQVVAGGVVAGEPGRLGVPAPLVESARGGVVGARRGLDDDQSSVVRRQLLLDRPQERGAPGRSPLGGGGPGAACEVVAGVRPAPPGAAPGRGPGDGGARGPRPEGPARRAGPPGGGARGVSGGGRRSRAARLVRVAEL